MTIEQDSEIANGRRLSLQERKAQTRAAIVDAASQLFREQGVDETSMAQIARLADTGVGTLYGYFPSKDDLLREVLQSVSRPHVERYTASVTPETDALSRIQMALDAYADFLRENRVIMRSAFMAGARHEIASELSSPTHQAFAKVLRTGIDNGELEPVPVESAVSMLMTAYTMAFLGLGSWVGKADDEQTRADLAAIVTAMLRRR